MSVPKEPDALAAWASGVRVHGSAYGGLMHRARGARMTSEARNGTGTAHVHHWMLSEPSGGEVPGRCKGCGEERGFPANPSNPYLRGLAKKRPTGRQN